MAQISCGSTIAVETTGLQLIHKDTYIDSTAYFMNKKYSLTKDIAIFQP